MVIPEEAFQFVSNVFSSIWNNGLQSHCLQLAMILLHLASIVWKLVIGVRIENEDGDGEVCGKVKSEEWGDLATFTEDKAHPHCLGTLRLKKEDGKILCLQKEDSYEDYLECNDDETDKSTTDRESSTTGLRQISITLQI